VEAVIRDFYLTSKIFGLTVLACLASGTNTHANSEKYSESPRALSSSVQVQAPAHTATQKSARSQDIFEAFAPKTQTLSTSFDYTAWDNALSDSVVQMGPSLRKFATRQPRPSLGSRITVKSRNSPYRLEGSRFTFFYISDSYVATLKEYKQDLLRLANEHDIQSFSRNEQLAFWINLHNVVLIEAIASKHPTKNPSALVFGLEALPLHDAKLMTIKNIPLSLRNIRENIVYENWDSPDVIYGFFRGDIGGPGLMPFAVTGENVKYVLATLGFEYTTSLRGFHTTKKERKVSQLYHEARPYYFSNWPQDIETHLKGYFQDHYLLNQVQQDKPISFIEYETVIADLWGGNNYLGSASVTNTSGFVTTPPILFERAKKIKELGVKGLLKRNYSVIIEDIKTENKSLSE